MKKLFIILLFPLLMHGQVFDGAYGYGADWVFSSYTVRKVTNLNDSGAGSWRDAVTQANTLLVFEVAGNIALDSNVTIAQNVYIAGQTAFRYGGEGINIYKGTSFNGPMVTIGGDNVIIRYLTFSGWPNPENCCTDALRLSGVSNVILDHITARYGNDEIIDFSGVNSNITIQYSIVSYALAEKESGITPGSSRAILMNGTNRFTFLGVLMAENTTRNALYQAGGNTPEGKGELVNNAWFNIKDQGFVYRTGSEGNLNVYGNIVIAGSISSTTRYMLEYEESNVPSGQIYLNDNIDPLKRPNSGLPESDFAAGGGNSDVAISAGRVTSTPHGYPLQTSYTAISAADYEVKILPTVGNSIVRDAIDSALDGYVTANTGIATSPAPLEATGYFATPIPARSDMSNVEADTDNDGIPDSEEGNWSNDTIGYVNSLAPGAGSPTPGIVIKGRIHGAGGNKFKIKTN